MNIQKLNGAMEQLKNSSGNALLASSIISYSLGQSIAVYHSQAKSDALLAQVTKFIADSMKESRFGSIGKFYSLLLENDRIAYVLVFDEYCWGMIFDTTKLPLGMIMNVITPECYDLLLEALK